MCNAIILFAGKNLPKFTLKEPVSAHMMRKSAPYDIAVLIILADHHVIPII